MVDILLVYRIVDRLLVYRMVDISLVYRMVNVLLAEVCTSIISLSHGIFNMINYFIVL
jgi:hypothetical protein